MKIVFTQIYAEPKTRFEISGMVLKLLSEQLDSLAIHISLFTNQLKTLEYELVFIISTTRQNNILEIKEPNIRRRAKEVEFSLFIPWKEIPEFSQQIEYVITYISQGKPCIQSIQSEQRSRPINLPMGG